jgi:GrpE
MTEDVLLKTLQKHGVERYDPSATNGEKFDPELHEAMFLAPKPDAEDGTVMHTQRKGIMLNGRVIRVSSSTYSSNLTIAGRTSWCCKKFIIIDMIMVKVTSQLALDTHTLSS